VSPDELVLMKVGIVRGHSRVGVADWDRDGKPDLLFCWHHHPGLFVARGPIDLTGEELRGFRRVKLDPDGPPMTAPEVVDWDRDGRPDLLLGTTGPAGPGVYWYRNLSDAGEPRYAPGVRLIPDPEGETVQGIAAIDWDGTGWPSLVVSRYRQQRKDDQWFYDARVDVYRREAAR
jgi:hypothetical protein